MSAKAKKVTVLLVAVIAIAALGLGAWGVSMYFLPFGHDSAQGYTISFNSNTVLMRSDAVTAPASGYVRRDFSAKVLDGEGYEVEDADISYSISKQVEGVELSEDGMLSVYSALQKGATFDVSASYITPAGEEISVSKKTSVKKDDKLKDVPRNPREKEGWELYFEDDFQSFDASSWSPYYLRNWVDEDARTRCDYRFDVNGEDTSLVISSPYGRRSWSSQNSGVVVSGISSYEHNYLHKFGLLGEGAVFNKDVGVFDGMATKYGYFELRMRMPDTRDGSHFAWWMIGVQDDMNDSAIMDGESVPMSGHYSNQTGEIDIIENTLSSLDGMKAWRPVIHPNGTTDYEYHWVDEATIPGNPMLEYHIYGFEWDKEGVKFYVDNKLVSSSDRSPSYRMMTFLTLYATGGLGEDRGIYPKEAFIDYIRVYKRTDTADKPMSVQLDMTTVPDCVYVPREGSNQVRLNAYVLDGMDRRTGTDVKWRLSETIDGFAPATSLAYEKAGVSISEEGVLIVTDRAWEGNKDVFVTAYYDDEVKQTYHIKLSRDTVRDDRLMFEGRGADVSEEYLGSGYRAVYILKKGESLQLKARLYDQYLNVRDVAPQYFLSQDLTGIEGEYDGVSLSGGMLHLSETSSLRTGDIITVTAKAGSKQAAAFIKVK